MSLSFKVKLLRCGLRGLPNCPLFDVVVVVVVVWIAIMVSLCAVCVCVCVRACVRACVCVTIFESETQELWPLYI